MKDKAISTPEIQAGNPEISMAPLIDVIFLLLIFFMVSTVFPDNRGIAVEKPSSETAEPLHIKKITFHLTHDEQILFKERVINTADVQRIVAETLRAAPDTAVLLDIDRRVIAQRIVSVMDACKKGGADKIGIATKKIYDSVE